MTERLSPGLGQAHVVIVNRWREHYADYAAYLDHDVNRVTYISTAVGLGSVPATATDIALVDATDDLEQVRAALGELASRHGAPDRVVGLKEDDLLVVAALREVWDLPGQRPDELVRFRDKLVMCRAIAEAGLPVPAFAPVAHAQDVLDLAATAGWPLIVKPRVGSSSAGVVRLDGPDDLAALPLTGEPMLVQAFDADPIYHVDGVFAGGEMLRWRASRYTNTCLGFRGGSVLGSVEEDDPLVNAAVGAAATAFLRALTDQAIPFHLELFVHRDGDEVSCSFLEVGARVGGAEIPFVWRDLHGYDLMEAAFRLQLGQDAPVPGPETEPGAIGGWLLVPAPSARPCLITETTSMLGRDPGPYAEALLSPGEVLPAADAYYEHVGGRFRFRGRSSTEVETALTSTAAGFRVGGEPVPQDWDPAPGDGVPMTARSHRIG
ncbi:MAG: biotin carboxylase [Actinomycetota bacterium]|nr:biotin carboxylase [Actinomycetota bacterium]